MIIYLHLIYTYARRRRAAHRFALGVIIKPRAAPRFWNFLNFLNFSDFELFWARPKPYIPTAHAGVPPPGGGGPGTHAPGPFRFTHAFIMTSTTASNMSPSVSPSLLQVSMTSFAIVLASSYVRFRSAMFDAGGVPLYTFLNTQVLYTYSPSVMVARRRRAHPIFYPYIPSGFFYHYIYLSVGRGFLWVYILFGHTQCLYTYSPSVMGIGSGARAGPLQCIYEMGVYSLWVRENNYILPVCEGSPPRRGGQPL